MGEGAQDFGGPRKEFFRLVVKEIKEQLFDNGLIEDCLTLPYIWYKNGIKCFTEWENSHFSV